MENNKISEPNKQVEEKDYWIDPDPDSMGLLLSDRIKFYVEKVNLVRPFDEESLRPASYTLHAGKDYLLNLKEGMKEGNLEEDKVVEIPPNGLIYIRFLEEINLPFYMIARFNLRVKQVYRGLLLGTGPQVDPGFRGHLNCPIHNFTDEPKRIKFRDPIATIDFEKTTTFGQTYFSDKSEDQKKALLFGEMRKSSGSIAGLNNFPCKTFEIMNDRPLRDYLPGGESVRSSVYELHEQVQQFGQDIKSYENRLSKKLNFSIAGVVSVLVAIVVLVFTMYFQLENNLFSSYRDLQDKLNEMSLSVDRLKESNRMLNSLVIRSTATAENKSLSAPVHPEKADVSPNQHKQTSK